MPTDFTDEERSLMIQLLQRLTIGALDTEALKIVGCAHSLAIKLSSPPPKLDSTENAELPI